MKMKEYEYHDVNFRGSIEKVTYETTNQAGEKRDKYALVYLPYGYDHNDTEKKYNILYLMHGGGGNPDAWLDCCKVKNMLDYSIDSGELAPLIVVFPSYYKEVISRTGRPQADQERENVRFFQYELSHELLACCRRKIPYLRQYRRLRFLKSFQNASGIWRLSHGKLYHLVCLTGKSGLFLLFPPSER